MITTPAQDYEGMEDIITTDFLCSYNDDETQVSDHSSEQCYINGTQFIWTKGYPN